MYTKVYVRESQPDWLTAGAHRRTSVDAMRELATALSTAEQNDGNHRRPWRLLGYEGYRCGRVRWGESRGWGLMQLSGDTANAWLRPTLECADSVSRLDLAVTVETDREDPDVGRRLYEEAKSWRVTHPKAARPWFIGGDGNGWTTYIGQRKSDVFFRCYDKAAETRDAGDESTIPQYANAWRFELELKGETAERTARRVLDSRELHRLSNGLVHRFLTDHGITPLWDRDQRVSGIGTFRRRSDRDRKLAWLMSQVRPTVRWLVENGDQAEVLARLGLQYGFAAAESSLLAGTKDGTVDDN